MPNEFRLFGVIGRPILHSKSPNIHNCFFDMANINARYVKIIQDKRLSLDYWFHFMGLKGMNVTSPYKEDAYELAGKKDDASVFLKAANTLVAAEDGVMVYNTDPLGVQRAFDNFTVSLKDKKVLVLGAGGAARAAAWAVVSKGGMLTVANRTFEKARTLADALKGNALSIDVLGETSENYDVVISALPPQANILQKKWFHARQVVMDAVYHDSLLRKWKDEVGYQFIDGSYWLINQAMAAFKIFSGKEEPIMLPIVPDGDKTKNVISLIGYMGSGKTTLGKELAADLGVSFVDMDHWIEQKAGKSISKIFSQDGEAYFRELESKTLKEILDSEERIVLSTGGGVVLNGENRSALKEKSLVFWLYCSLDQAFKRMDHSTRPLIKEEAFGKYQSIFKDRFSLYGKCAEVIVSTEKSDEKTICKEIRYNLDQARCFKG